MVLLFKILESLNEQKEDPLFIKLTGSFFSQSDQDALNVIYWLFKNVIYCGRFLIETSINFQSIHEHQNNLFIKQCSNLSKNYCKSKWIKFWTYFFYISTFCIECIRVEIKHGFEIWRFFMFMATNIFEFRRNSSKKYFHSIYYCYFIRMSFVIQSFFILRIQRLKALNLVQYMSFEKHDPYKRFESKKRTDIEWNQWNERTNNESWIIGNRFGTHGIRNTKI